MTAKQKAPITDSVRAKVIESMEAHREYVKKKPPMVLRKMGEDSKGESIFKVDAEASGIRRLEELKSIDDRIDLYRETGTFKDLT